MNTHTEKYSITLALSYLGLLAACSSPETPVAEASAPSAVETSAARPTGPVATAIGKPRGELVSKTIGSAGGELESIDQELAVIVPAGAFVTDTVVSIQEISNEAHGNTGKAYRITPEGLNTPLPMTIRFKYNAADLSGAQIANLGIATQANDKTWDVYRQPIVDTRARTLSISTTHFSDWSKVRGAQLLPGSATIKVNGSVGLHAVVCYDAPPEAATSPPTVSDDDLIVPSPPSPKPPVKPRKLYKCESFAATNARLKNWSVNGVTGGSNATGTVGATSGPLAGTATYRAPDKVPASNPVAVSVDLPAAEGLEKQTLVSMIKIIDHPILHAFVEMTSDGYGGENCEGGQWNLNWDGQIAVAAEADSDLMRNYTAFDTTLPQQEAIKQASFASTPLICRDNDGNVGMRAEVGKPVANSVKLSISLARNEGADAQRLVLSMLDLGTCHTDTGAVKMAIDGLGVHIDTSLTDILSPALDITLEDLKKGFHKTYDLKDTPPNLHPLCMGFKLRSGRIILIYETGDQE